MPSAENQIENVSRWRLAGICLALAAITFAVFGQTVHHGFVNFDDDEYVYQNPVVSRGLTRAGIVWAFSFHANNWHPLTWISHMLDCQCYGLNPGGHHLTNVLLHAATAIVLFLVLRQMTGAFWRSAFVAAVFAIHPLRVESVAWVAERKDVLSGLFCVLALAAYVGYARRPSFWRYALVALLFGLGLMSKPMLVTLPGVLLVLDYWPLRRGESIGKLLLEKLPLCGLSVGVAIATILAQHGTLESTTAYPLGLRFANALDAGVVYLGQMVWPGGLAPFYPYPHHGIHPWKLVWDAAVMAGLSFGAWLSRRNHPWLAMGWAWYLIMLLPVIGIIQVGDQAHADRYTYLPQIGLYLALTWELARWLSNRAVAAVVMASVVAALAVVAARQTAFWKDSETLWAHALACTTDNYVAALNLGDIYLNQGRVDDAISLYQASLKIHSSEAEPHFDLASALRKKGRTEEAMAEYQRALKINPAHVKAHYNLGALLEQTGHMDDAIAQFQEVARLDPGNADALISLGNACLRAGQLDPAVAAYRKALELNPGYGRVHNNLGNALLRQGNVGEAISQYEKALEAGPPDAGIANNLAWLLAAGPDATLRDGPKAVTLARQANALGGDRNPLFLRTLAAALAEAGQFPEAVAAARQCLDLVQAQPGANPRLIEQLRYQLSLYEAGKPFHLPGQTNK